MAMTSIIIKKLNVAGVVTMQNEGVKSCNVNEQCISVLSLLKVIGETKLKQILLYAN